ncbi:putative lactoylglutathione lyase [Agrobacterium tumefaciens]|nr:putative lactoylglutathione lyase [Agrobacterium tumefaciens]
MTKPYSVDHLVLPVEVIGVAVKRLVSLGFTVAPEALHPFGTQNACVFSPMAPIWSRSQLLIRLNIMCQ